MGHLMGRLCDVVLTHVNTPETALFIHEKHKKRELAPPLAHKKTISNVLIY